ncbi:unnamed protein product [Dracunculus medinensis]|uniref:PPM-type phosphatase domain-containing protein n=1 Tax=Dracunculus medinensis TaxID=318479 RepID=A0A0N4U7F3_DRAME|nr:unnamed protein product [Dracunculus medinensis]
MLLKTGNLFIQLNRRSICGKAEMDAKIRAYQQSVSVLDDAIDKITFSQLPANNPIEDHYSIAKCLHTNSYFFGIFDGHGSECCSRHVSVRLYDYLCASVLKKYSFNNLSDRDQLKWIFSSSDRDFSPSFRQRHAANLEKFIKNDSMDTATMMKVIENAFLAMDDDISNDALPDTNGNISRNRVKIAVSGSCGIVAHLRKNHLHVANVGDSVAILGTLKNGHIAPQLLSKLHSCDNTDEIKRVRSAHPISESETILRSDRLLGELYPLRAFGDVRYKWPLKLQKIILAPFDIDVPNGLQTPPYLTALPEVFYHRLTSDDQFLILASDGLWEWLDPDTVVRLVYDHTIGTETLTPYQPDYHLSLSEASHFNSHILKLIVFERLQKRLLGECKKPLDENSATHLIRHALGGCASDAEEQYLRLKDMLESPPGTARNIRDDISIIIVHFSQQYLQMNRVN